ncbi:MAG: hypothetical protein ICV51_11000 [Flavisolibacter sp.]|nr:hypothetical protein [Flavisolibacter sp.]
MSLNQIQLTPYQIAALYSDVLLDTPAMAMPNTPAITYFGGYAQNILILVNKPDETFLSERELSFLNNILGACKLTIADVALVNWVRQSLPFNELLDSFLPKTILFFDLSPQDVGLPLHFPQYQIQVFKEITFLHAPSLLMIENEKSHKAWLWTSLKKLFGI